jgi:hypothetical protein
MSISADLMPALLQAVRLRDTELAILEIWGYNHN